MYHSDKFTRDRNILYTEIDWEDIQLPFNLFHESEYDDEGKAEVGYREYSVTDYLDDYTIDEVVEDLPTLKPIQINYILNRILQAVKQRFGPKINNNALNKLIPNNTDKELGIILNKSIQANPPLIPNANEAVRADPALIPNANKPVRADPPLIPNANKPVQANPALISDDKANELLNKSYYNNNNMENNNKNWDVCWNYVSPKGCHRYNCAWKHVNP